MKILLIVLAVLLTILLLLRRKRPYGRPTPVATVPVPRERQDPKETERRLDGFDPLSVSPLALTDHARLRFHQRLNLSNPLEMRRNATSAYYYGKSARQVPRNTAAKLRDLELRHAGESDDRIIALLYANRIYLFTQGNVLITLFPFEENYRA